MVNEENKNKNQILKNQKSKQNKNQKSKHTHSMIQ